MSLSRDVLELAKAGDWDAVQALQAERDAAIMAAARQSGDADALAELRRLNDELLRAALDHRRARVGGAAADRRQADAASRYLDAGSE